MLKVIGGAAKSNQERVAGGVWRSSVDEIVQSPRRT
jgi:hypothetical protein